jgi:hypothetical protein
LSPLLPRMVCDDGGSFVALARYSHNGRLWNGPIMPTES